MADLMDEAIEISHKLLPCNICGRTFLPSPLKKHAKVCEKNATRKRKTFNSLKQRIEGTELAVFHQKTLLRSTAPVQTQPQHPQHAQQQVHGHPRGDDTTSKRNQSKWKEKHEELVQAIRAAKGEKIMAPRRSISAVGSMGTTEQCPSCDRHFGPKAYDRHVEWCKEHKIRASKSPAIVTIAKERLEARTKYRVPPLTKSKRSLTRDKYASPSGRSQDGGGGGGGGGGSGSGNGAGLNVRSTSSLEQHSSSNKKTKQKGCAPLLAEPVIKHNSEKLKSSNFKYRVYPLIKMNDTNINESVLDMTVSQMNLRPCPQTPPSSQSQSAPSASQSHQKSSQSTSSSSSSSQSSQIKLITWKDTKPKQTNNNSDLEQNVSKSLPFTINLVDSEPQSQSNTNTDSNIDYETTNSDTVSGLPTIAEEETESGNLTAPLVTIKEVVRMRDSDDDDDPTTITMKTIDEIQEEEEQQEEEFRSSTPVNQTDTTSSIKIRNNSISFDISPVLKPKLTEKEEEEWQDLDDYYKNYKNFKTKRKKRRHKILDRFLKEKRENCRLEVEIIANERCCHLHNSNEKRKERRSARHLNMYRVNSSEIVIRGERCIDALNKSFSRNKIKHVNIVFVNEDTKRESEIYLRTDDTDTTKTTTQESRKLNKREQKQRNLRDLRELDRDRKRDMHMERDRDGDNYWEEQREDNEDEFNECDTTLEDDDDDNEDDDYTPEDDDEEEEDLILPPINLKKKSCKEEDCFDRETPPEPVRFPPIHEEKYQSYKKNEHHHHHASNKKHPHPHPLMPLKRTVSMTNPVVKARSMKNKQDIQDYLHVKGTPPSSQGVRDKAAAHAQKGGMRSRPQSTEDDLFPVGHDMYSEYKKYEDMYRREQEDDEQDPDQDQEENEDDASSAEEVKIKRKSLKTQPTTLLSQKPRQSAKPTQKQKQQRSPSSSGSETHRPNNSTPQNNTNNNPNTNTNNNPTNTNTNNNFSNRNRLTKFCHECGTKYPLDSAKFCVECGIKRLVL